MYEEDSLWQGVDVYDVSGGMEDMSRLFTTIVRGECRESEHGNDPLSTYRMHDTRELPRPQRSPDCGEMRESEFALDRHLFLDVAYR